MASLVLGVAGAVIGNLIPAVGASLGWSIGSTLGSVLFGEKPPTQYGPRLSDLKIQTSTYGNDIARVYGTMRLAGNMIWSTPIIETKHKKKSGGKGGQKATVVTYTYSQSFAVGVCTGPIIGIRKIWANGELIYNVGSGASVTTLIQSKAQAAGITIYTGSETQEANSLIQTNVGATDCPAYRGLAYVVFTNLQLAKYGNRTPNLEFEVVGSGTLDSWVTLLASPLPAYGSVVSYENGLVYCGESYGSPGYRETVYDVEGNIVVPETQYTPTYASVSTVNACRNWRGLFFSPYAPGRWMNGIGNVRTDAIDCPAWFITVMGTCAGYMIRFSDHVVHIGSTGGEVRMIAYPYDAGEPIPNLRHDLDLQLFTYSTITDLGTYGDLAEEAIYYLFKLNGSANYTLNKYSSEGALLDYWDLGSTITHSLSHQFKVEEGVFYLFGGSVDLVRLNDDHTATVIGTASALVSVRLCALGMPGIYWSPQYVYRLGQPVDTDAVFVESIVEEECALVGLSGAAVDASSVTDTVIGYSINRRGTVRSGLEPLMRAFYFDAVEADEAVQFVKRGAAVAATLPEDDLAAHPWGADMPDAVLLERTQDVELPDEITVNYMDSDAAYQVGTQYARRLIGSSRVQQTVPMAMAIGAGKAKEIAEVLMYDAWQGRVSFRFTTGNKYSHLVPSDVISLVKGGRSYTARILARDEQAGLITFLAAWEDLQIYSQTGTGASLPAPSDEVAGIAYTRLLLLDAPLLRDADDEDGFYAAACGYTADWPGCQLFKSSDAGATWGEFGTVMLNESTLGFASTALGDFTQNLFDETNSVTVRLTAGTLESVTEADVLNGANAAMLGDEVIQFRTATLTGTMTYALTGLLRGRRGTEWARSTHVAAERFVLLEADTTYRQPAANAEIGLARHYRGVSFGLFLEDAEVVALTYQGVSLMPFSPVLLGGGRNAAGDITINWVRRGRIGSEWTDNADVPLGEESESYEVEVWTSGYATLKRTITATTQTASYTSAQQTTDFGGNQSTVYLRVYQLSASVGRGYKLEGTV